MLVSGTNTLRSHTSKEGGCKGPGTVKGVTFWGLAVEKQQPMFESNVDDPLLGREPDTLCHIRNK